MVLLHTNKAIQNANLYQYLCDGGGMGLNLCKAQICLGLFDKIKGRLCQAQPLT